MQAMHPGAMAGVHDHSRYREDPLGRLNGTIRWITTVTYGSTRAGGGGEPLGAAAARAGAGHLHDHATAATCRTRRRTTTSSPGSTSRSRTPSSARSSGTPTGRCPAAPTRTCATGPIAGELMGVPDPPRSVAELDARLEGIRDAGVLRCGRAGAGGGPVHPTAAARRACCGPRTPPSSAARSRPCRTGRARCSGSAPVLPVEEVATGVVLRSSARLLGEAAAPGQARIRLAALGAPRRRRTFRRPPVASRRADPAR